MKKSTIAFFLLSVLMVSISCQMLQKSPKTNVETAFENGSGIVFPPLDHQLIDNLELLGKLWGFLKYHHPQVATGSYNWDFELFRLLPAYLRAGSLEERDQILLDWIAKYGEIPVCTTCRETATDAYLKPNLSWVDSSNMHTNLKEKVHEIYTNRFQGSHYYISYPEASTAHFTHENRYLGISYPDAGFRLLALYRFWNMIHYFYPYKFMTDKNWDGVLKEYIPLFLTAESPLEYQLIVTQIIGDINDTHAKLYTLYSDINKLRGYFHALYEVRFIEQQWVVTADNNPPNQVTKDLKIGDIITHINGKYVDSIVDSIRIYYPASNEAVRLRDISRDLLRSANNTLHVRYISEGNEKHTILPLYPKFAAFATVKQEEKCYKLIDNNIGYVTFANIKYGDIKKMKELFTNTEGIIIDMRNYPSVSGLTISLAPYFVSDSTPYMILTKGNENNPGEFTVYKNLDVQEGDETYQGKSVVIVNELTQSQAETNAMAFKVGHNTTIIGSTTAGANGDCANIYLPGGILTMISSLGVYYPDGSTMQRIGIVPDVWVEPTINGIKQGRDELLEKAIEIIQKQ